MIITDALSRRYSQEILRSLCCPVCLSPLIQTITEKEEERLKCQSCEGMFPVLDGVPILLLEDENWRQKDDEIEGEETYNKERIHLNVHIERNAFVDGNTEMFLAECNMDLSEHHVLIVGCSMTELQFFSKKARSVVCLDIVPSATKASFEATRHRKIPAAWICGDGECLPFEDKTFDTVIVRQTLHHMLKYYASICELFRVCKRDGYVLIIDEPFSPINSGDMAFLSLQDDVTIYGDVRLRQIIERAKIDITQGNYERNKSDICSFDKKYKYIEPTSKDPETFLADKYHSFSLLNCIYAIRFHSNDFELNWPREVAWVVEKKGSIKFCHGPNPEYKKGLVDKLISPGNASIAARKEKETIMFRNRSDVRPLPLDLALKLAGR